MPGASCAYLLRHLKHVVHHINILRAVKSNIELAPFLYMELHVLYFRLRTRVKCFLTLAVDAGLRRD